MLFALAQRDDFAAQLADEFSERPLRVARTLRLRQAFRQPAVALRTLAVDLAPRLVQLAFQLRGACPLRLDGGCFRDRLRRTRQQRREPVALTVEIVRVLACFERVAFGFATMLRGPSALRLRGGRSRLRRCQLGGELPQAPFEEDDLLHRGAQELWRRWSVLVVGPFTAFALRFGHGVVTLPLLC